jgi:hypothetical protein
MKTKLLILLALSAFLLAGYGCASENPEGTSAENTKPTGSGTLEKDPKSSNRAMATPAETSSE